MDATVYGEDEVVTGVTVTDNDGVEHDIQVERDGEIYSHHQDGYPDAPAERTPEGNEHVVQARRFARYWVYSERGYSTLDPWLDPARASATWRLVRRSTTEEFESLFGDLHRQLRSHHSDVRPVVSIPDAADPDSVMYKQDVYLDVDLAEMAARDAVEPVLEKYGIDVADVSTGTPLPEEAATELADRRDEFLADLDSVRDSEAFDFAEGVYIEGVSGVYVRYRDADGNVRETAPGDGFDRDPDAILEFAPIDPGPLAEFQEFLAHNLRCRARDCFVRLGVEPPGVFQVTGPGLADATDRYERLDLYPDYHEPGNEAAFE